MATAVFKCDKCGAIYNTIMGAEKCERDNHNEPTGIEYIYSSENKAYPRTVTLRFDGGIEKYYHLY